MGFQLWYSKETGKRRKGTTFSELQEIFINNITTKYIYEPLACCGLEAPSFEVLESLKQLDFDILGVNDGQNILGYIKRKELAFDDTPIKKHLHKIMRDQVISESSSIINLFNILGKEGYIFVGGKNGIEGIVSKADINKPIVRMYIFGLISLFELHLNFWITEFYTNESWNGLIKEERLASAIKIFEERRGHNLELTLLECLQISDKKEILRNTDAFTKKIGFSKTKLKNLIEDIETIRNEIAHSQNSIISNLSWERFTQCIFDTIKFLEKSEIEVTK